MLNSIFASLSGKDLWEIRTTETVAGDTPFDSPVLTTKKVQIKGLFSSYITQNHRLVGIAEDADAVLATTSDISLDSQVESDDVVYEIVGKQLGTKGYFDKVWMYILKRQENTP